MYEEFIKRILFDDSRNVIKKNEITIDNKAPKVFKLYNFVDVEIKLNNAYLHFVSNTESNKYQKLYSYVDGDYVFGTINGDPIFMKNNKVYTCNHGTPNPKYELLYNSFEDFIKEIMSR